MLIPRKPKAIAAVGSLLLVFLAALLLASHNVNHGPNHRGQSLEQWLYDLELTGPRKQRAEKALQEMGTNALPFLMELRFQQPSRFGSLMRSVATTFIPRYSSPKDRLQTLARSGLVLLGTNTGFWVARNFAHEPLIVSEKLNAFTEEPHPVSRAGEVLLYDLQTNSVPVFFAALGSSTAAVRFHASYVLWSKPTVELHGNLELSRMLIHRMRPLLDDDMPAVRAMALLALTSLNQHAQVADVVRWVTPHLEDPHSGVRYCAAVYLGAFPQHSRMIQNEIASALSREKTTPEDSQPGAERFVGERSGKQLVSQLERVLKSVETIEP